MKKINFKRLVARNNRLILAYEKKYAKQIGRALQKQLKDYLKTGILSDEITPILTDMYMSVGERFYLNQYKLLSDISQKNLFIDAFKIWWTNYVTTVLAEKVTQINETTLTKLQNSLGDLIPQSLEFEEMASRLMKDFDFSIQRAMTISRTEVGNAMNEAKLKGKDDIKEELGEEIWKIWIHRGSKNPRDWHLHLDNGKAIHEDDVWRVEKPSTGFTEPMSRPHDPTASAENVINCGCEVMYISYSYAVRNGMIDVTDYPIAQPAIEIEAPQANETVTVGDLPPSTDETISSDLADVFKGLNINIDAKSVVYDNSLTLKDKNELKNKLNELVREYKMDIDVSEHQGVKLSFKSEGNTLGFVRNSRVHIGEINFGHIAPKDSTLKESVFRTTMGGKKGIKFVHSAIVDDKNVKYSTLVHEFAHIITDEARTKGSMKSPANIKFFKDLKKIRKDYHTEMNSLIKIRDVESLNKIHISQYAHTNINEFMAESFMQYKLSSNPSPYAVKVGRLMDKNFKK